VPRIIAWAFWLKLDLLRLPTMASFMVYEGDLGDKRYLGLTGLELEDRCDNMKARPVLWLRGHRRLKTLQLVPLLGRRVAWKLGLAIEAARTAAAGEEQPEVVRGGPWCLKRLDRGLVEELQKVADAVRKARGPYAEAEAVWRVAKTMDKNSALGRHLRGECFKCGVYLGWCQCKRTSSGSGASRAADLGVEAAKPRSGKAGHDYRQERGWAASSKEYKKNKWGPKYKRNKRRDNRKYPGRSGRR